MYYWDYNDPERWSDYATLYRKDGTQVTTLTEVEDRTFVRDLRPVIDELNRLVALQEGVAEIINSKHWHPMLTPDDTLELLEILKRLYAESTSVL